MVTEKKGPAVINLPEAVEAWREASPVVCLKFGTLAEADAFLAAIREARKPREQQHAEYAEQHGLRGQITAEELE